MGTSNFLYRDTLYALDTYVSPDDCDCDCEHEAECTCEHEAECTCEHEAECTCDCDGYHDEFIYDEFIYDDIKESLRADLNGYCKANPNYTIYGDDAGRTNDNRNFEGHIVGRIYKEFTLGDEHTVAFVVGDDFCLRSGYYHGFNFDRVVGKYSTYGTNELENVNNFIHEAIFNDKLCINAAVDDGDLNFLEAEALKEKIYAEVIAEVEAFIAEADRIFHELGEKYFESYRVVAQDK